MNADSPVLVLNAHRHPIDVTRVSHAISLLIEESAYVLDGGRAYDWTKWIAVAPGPRVLRSPSISVNIPHVIVCPDRHEVHWHTPALTKVNLWIRDRGICQYTGRSLFRGTGNMDHVVPQADGGPTSWEHCVLCDRELSTWKAARRPQQCGLRLLRDPAPPAPTPIPYQFFGKPLPPAWKPFFAANRITA